MGSGTLPTFYGKACALYGAGLFAIDIQRLFICRAAEPDARRKTTQITA